MKKAVSMLLVLALCLSFIPNAFAASDEAIQAANNLYELGLFKGVGTNSDGTPKFDLDRAPTRNEAVTMLVRLLGKEEEALEGTWETPFTDVASWAKPYVGYAYANKLTNGTSATRFGGDSLVSATQYLTFVLRALGYESGTDFQWDKAWNLTDQIGITGGEYNDSTDHFLRADVALISDYALCTTEKDSDLTLLDSLIQDGAVINESADIYRSQPVRVRAVEISDTDAEIEVGKTKQLLASVLPQDADDTTIKWESSDPSIVSVTSDGLVSALKKGTATISAVSNNGKRASCVISVYEVEAVEPKWYSDSMYRVGTDLPEGAYYAVATNASYSGYYALYNDSAQSKIFQNDIFDTFDFFYAKSGQYLRLNRCKIASVDDVPTSIAAPKNGVYGTGVYRVGIDIPAGEYKFTITTEAKEKGISGYYCIYSDITKNKIKKNNMFDSVSYITANAGELLKVTRATFTIVSEDNANPSNNTWSSYYQGTSVPTFRSVIYYYNKHTCAEASITRDGAVAVYKYEGALAADVELYKSTLENVFGFTKDDLSTDDYINYESPDKSCGVTIAYVSTNARSLLILSVASYA